MKFQRFKRGSVVMVEFSPSMGSEIKEKHLAIVLTKNDSPNNGVLTVILLSSKMSLIIFQSVIFFLMKQSLS